MPIVVATPTNYEPSEISLIRPLKSVIAGAVRLARITVLSISDSVGHGGRNKLEVECVFRPGFRKRALFNPTLPHCGGGAVGAGGALR